MPRKSIFAIAVLLGILFAVGYAEAAERDTSARTQSIRSVAPAAAQLLSTGSVGLPKILRARFLHSWKLLKELGDSQEEPPVFGTNGLSDGPDPIDGTGQVGGGSQTLPDTEDGQTDSPGDETAPDGDDGFTIGSSD